MSYLVITEDFKTTIHNALSGYIGGYHFLDTKDMPMLGLLRALFKAANGTVPTKFLLNLGSKLIGGKDIVDKAYFDHHWNIDPIIPQIEKWCKQEKKALLVNDKIKSRIPNTSSKKFGDTTHEIGNARTYLANPSLLDVFNKKLDAKKRFEKFTTALTCIPIKSGNGFYYIYPIFDADDIRDIKVLCSGRGQLKSDLYCKSLKQWKSIDHEQFKK